MMTADVAWILAYSGKRVLVIDWNFENPGLHQYLHPFLPEQYEETEGLIDLLWEQLHNCLQRGDGESPEEVSAQELVERYRVALQHTFPRGGRLDYLSAGRAASFHVRSRLFPWASFLRVHDGDVFLSSLRRALRRSYDYIVIDGRTGRSDRHRITTDVLADLIVGCFQLAGNGPLDLAAALSLTRENRKGVRIFPIATGVQSAEMELLMSLRVRAREACAPMLGHIEVDQRDHYWVLAEVPYQPYFAYVQIPSIFQDRSGTPGSVLASMESLTEWLTGEKVRQDILPTDELRDRVIDAYKRGSLNAPIPEPELAVPYVGTEPFVFVSYKREELDRIVLTLQQMTQLGYPVWWDEGIPGGAEWRAHLDRKIEGCAVLAVFVSRKALASDWVKLEVTTAERLGKSIVPIALETDVASEGSLGRLLERYQTIHDPRDTVSPALEEALRIAMFG